MNKYFVISIIFLDCFNFSFIIWVKPSIISTKGAEFKISRMVNTLRFQLPSDSSYLEGIIMSYYLTIISNRGEKMMTILERVAQKEVIFGGTDLIKLN